MTALAAFGAGTLAKSLRSQCRRMLDAQRLYAPEREAVWEDEGVAIGRRLFPHPAGRSLRQGAGHRSWRQICSCRRHPDRQSRRACRALGIADNEARSLSDASILMRCWEKWDEAALQRISGDFAFALWEGSRRRLIGARSCRQPPSPFQPNGLVAGLRFDCRKGCMRAPGPTCSRPGRPSRFYGFIARGSRPILFSRPRTGDARANLVATRGGMVATRYCVLTCRRAAACANAGEYEERCASSRFRRPQRNEGSGASCGQPSQRGARQRAVAATAARLMGSGRAAPGRFYRRTRKAMPRLGWTG